MMALKKIIISYLLRCWLAFPMKNFTSIWSVQRLQQRVAHSCLCLLLSYNLDLFSSIKNVSFHVFPAFPSSYGQWKDIFLMSCRCLLLPSQNDQKLWTTWRTHGCGVHTWQYEKFSKAYIKFEEKNANFFNKGKKIHFVKMKHSHNNNCVWIK